jgi:argininosuccinate synthase
MTKVAVAFSGTLDTAICVHWLKNVKGMKVYTFSANFGQFEHLQPLAEKALEIGAVAAHIADLREKFINEYVFPCLLADAVYGQGYFLFSALSRPLIAEELVKIAREEGCEYIAHGSREKGNDWFRFKNYIQHLAPELKIVAPLQETKLCSPSDDIQFAKKHGIKVEEIKHTLYNIEQNVWGANIQIAGRIQPWEEPEPDTYVMVTPPTDTPDKAGTAEIEFEKGLPVKLNDEKIPPLDLIEQLNRLGGMHGIGRIDVIEDKIAGEKRREIYEAPAATILYKAREALSSLILDREETTFKYAFSQKYAQLVYNGLWFHPLRRAFDQFFKVLNERINGSVKLSLFKGNLNIIGRKPA